LGYDLKKLLWESDEAKLMNTEFAQPAIFAASLVSLTALQENGIVENIADVNAESSKASYACAGHSLGEYAALVACGVLDMESGFKAIGARGRIMAKAGEANPGGMTAVIGMTAEQVEEICTEAGVVLANYNSPVQNVIAGKLENLERAEELLKQKEVKRLKVVRLKTSAAFHTELMRTAANEFLEEAKSLTFSAAKADFYSNVYADLMTDNFSPEYLFAHMCCPVKFVPQLQKIHADGYGTFIEVGPGKVLSGLTKKTLGDLEGVQIYNVENMEDLEKCKTI
jgi:[acyl-carrier-protein] S-malonyltransferase